MPSKYGNTGFYNSKEWRRVSAAYMASKNYLCERCGRPAKICHHRKWLNDRNVHDPETALSFKNLECLCQECHNKEHGSTHDRVLFDEAGNVAAVKECSATRELKQYKKQIDQALEAVRSLPVVSCENQ